MSAGPVALHLDEILDEPFFAMALSAFITEARAAQGWPDPEKTRQRAYRLYEEERAARNKGCSRSATPERNT